MGMAYSFERLVERYGIPEQAYRPSSAEFQALDGHVPDDLLAFWQAHGIGLWEKGRFQFCLPQRFAPVVNRIFANDCEILPNETHVIGYSAFGNLLVWNEVHQRLLIDLLMLEVDVPKLRRNKQGQDYPLTVPLVRLGASETTFDVFEDTETAEPLFKRAMAKLGALEPGQCYGFFPAPAFGGRQTLDHLQRVGAREHFSFLADLDRFRLIGDDVSLVQAASTLRMIGD